MKLFMEFLHVYNMRNVREGYKKYILVTYFYLMCYVTIYVCEVI